MQGSNNTPLNLLASFAYLGKRQDFVDAFFGAHRSGRANVMIDSGAFTKLNAKEEREWLTLDTYCDFAGKYGESCEKYVALDVVGNEEATKRNYETMVERGLTPMFVLTMYDNDWNYLRSTMKVNPHCCVAGGTMTKGPWIIKRFQEANRQTENTIKIHGLGYVAFPNIIRAPIVSGDSSSWIQACQHYGLIQTFSRTGLSGTPYVEFWRGKKMPDKLKDTLNRLEITPAEFVKKSNHRGALSIGTLLSIVAYIEYQKHVYRHGKRLFLAVSSKTSLDKIFWANDNFKTLTYAQFKKEFGKE